MTRSTTFPADLRTVRPDDDAAPLALTITDDTFHRAFASATAHTNTVAGESFIRAATTYVRVNERHFRIEGECSHAEALAIVGRSPCWRDAERRR